MAGFGSIWHLAKRFVGSLSRARPPADDDGWARGHLGPGEQTLWARLDPADQRHAVGVARRVVADLGDPERAVVAAALLHDVGKTVSGLGTFGRVGATVVTVVVGRARVAARAGDDGAIGRVGAYVTHDVIGAALLHDAGADPLTVAWAAEHHLPPERWTVPAEIGRALHAADDD